eukprot:1160813-Pelagomonas_calceolata.AAC.11
MSYTSAVWQGQPDALRTWMGIWATLHTPCAEGRAISGMHARSISKDARQGRKAIAEEHKAATHSKRHARGAPRVCQAKPLSWITVQKTYADVA